MKSLFGKSCSPYNCGSESSSINHDLLDVFFKNRYFKKNRAICYYKNNEIASIIILLYKTIVQQPHFNTVVLVQLS